MLLRTQKQILSIWNKHKTKREEIELQYVVLYLQIAGFYPGFWEVRDLIKKGRIVEVKYASWLHFGLAWWATNLIFDPTVFLMFS